MGLSSGQGNPIPTKSRELVREREGGRCLRCGSSNAHDMHHRRGRRERDEHQHCPCNLVLLCRACHDWAHGPAREATTGTGYIVNRWVAEPTSVSLDTRHGVTYLDCDGDWVSP